MAAGLVLLLALWCAAAAPAFAHAGPHGAPAQPSPTMALAAPADPVPPAILGGHAVPTSDATADICPPCCALGGCSIVGAMPPGGPAVALPVLALQAVFGPGIAPQRPGVPPLPAMKPPRLAV